MTGDLQQVARIRDDITLFGRECARIRAKDGSIVPFELNASQIALHERVEAQRREFGFVRALVLKGRQQGISTYVSLRFYQRASMRRGVNVYILSHEQTASDTLFGIVDRMHRHNPLKPHVGVSNIKELEFDRLDSSYVVATAGNKAGGRSKAITLFHGSEVAFWASASEHFAASVQGVPLAHGTEVILESTSAGVGGEFFERYCDAEAGRGDYIAVFLPWWLTDDYTREPPVGFTLSNVPDEIDAEGLCEQEYAETFGLSDARMAWRRAKIIELRNPELFRREYPATAAEAWTAPPGFSSFINARLVLRARKREGEGAGPLILGVDPASNGGDRFSIAGRRGNKVVFIEYRNKIDALEGAYWIKSMILQHRPARVNVDAGNIGAAIISMLKAMGPEIATIVRSVNFGATSEAKLARPKVPGPVNRRAEMWARMLTWLESEDGPVIPDLDALQTDLTAPRLKPRPNNDFVLESKVEMRSRRVRSPDFADAMALTFASNEFFNKWEEPLRAPCYGDLTQTIDTSIAPSLPLGHTGWMAALIAFASAFSIWAPLTRGIHG